MTAKGHRPRPTLHDIDLDEVSRLVTAYLKLVVAGERDLLWMSDACSRVIAPLEDVLPGREFDDFSDAISPYFRDGPRTPAEHGADIVRTFHVWRRLVQVSQRAVQAARQRARPGGRPKSADDYKLWASKFDRIRKQRPSLSAKAVHTQIAEEVSPDPAKPLSHLTIRNGIAKHKKAAKAARSREPKT